MKPRHFLGSATLALGLFISQNGQAQVSTPLNVPTFPGLDYVGWNNSITVPLMVRHDGNYPIQWWTDNVLRMQLNQSLPGQPVNGFPSVDLSGHLGIGAPVPAQALSLLHINNNGSYFAGFRPWMRTGVSMSENTDWMYVGAKNEGDDRIDAVINWGDNKEVSEYTGPDALRFIFTRANSGINSASKLDGLELARFIPDPSGNEGYFGLGDYFTAGINPSERLDVLDGRVRIRKLPTDSQATTLDQYMVVDNTGVVKWRHLPASTTTGCEWEAAGGLETTAWRAVGTNGTCPDASWNVGIGKSLPAYKLDIFRSEADAAVSGGLRMDLRTNSGGWRYGILSTVEPMVGGANLAFAASIRGLMYNVGLASSGVADSYGLFGDSRTDQDLYLRHSIGVYGEAVASAGHPAELYGGSFRAANSGATVTAAYGVYAEAQNATSNFAIYGYAPVATNNWAGYFAGNVNVTGIATVPGNIWTPSDENLKEGIVDIPDALNVISQLHPKSYDYRVDEFPQASLPSGQQYGFLAQELEQVIPEAVKDFTFPAKLDTMGQEINPALPTKVVNTAMVIPFLVAAVQQQQSTIAQLQNQINNCCAAQGGMAPQGGMEQKMAPQENDLQEQRLLIIPNPVADLTTLEYYVPKAGKVSLQVSTSDGKPLATLREELAEAGAYNYSWNTTQLVAGTYFCTFMLDGAVVVKRAVKVK